MSTPMRVLAVLGVLLAAVVLAVPAQARPGWERAAPLDQAIDDPAATRLPDGRVLLAGGRSLTSPTDGAEIYDPGTDTWSPTGRLEFDSAGGQFTVLADGRVILTVGEDGFAATRALQIYDPETNSWSTSSDPPGSFVPDQAARLTDGAVLITDRSTESTGALRWHPDTDAWTASADPPTDLAGASLARLADGRVLAAGSGPLSAHHPTPTAAAAIYDPATNRWSRMAPMVHARGIGHLVLLRSGEVLAIGGIADATTTPVLGVDRFDPVAERWSDAGALPYPLTGAAARMQDGSVLAQTDATLARYDPATNLWSRAGAPEPMRVYSALVGLRDGRALVAGGFWNYTDLGDTELRDPYTSLSLAPLQFGGQVVGSAPAVGYLPVWNTGDNDLELDPPAISGAQAGEFGVVSDSCTSGVAPGAACLIGVSFAPGATGARHAVLSFADSTPSQLHAVALTGIGVAAAPGPPGSPGQTGPRGPRGRPGRDARVTCRVIRVKHRRRIRCRVRYGSKSASARIRVARGRATVARSSATLRHGRARMTLRPRHRLHHGRYRISVTVSTPRRNVVAATTLRVR